MYVFVCVCVCMYRCMCMHMYVYVFMYMYTWTHTHRHMLKSFAGIFFGLPTLLRGRRVGIKYFTWVCLFDACKTPKR